VQGLAKTRSIFATKPIVTDIDVAKILEKAGLHPVEQRAALRGITDDALVYEIP
jgi:hypothetical protein